MQGKYISTNTNDVTEWFIRIQTKPDPTFITVDIVSFYPSMTKALTKKAIEFVRKHTTISHTDEQVIHLAKDTLLFQNGQSWKKSNTDALFDVSMGSFNAVKTCEIVSAHILSEISPIIPSNSIGLYRDDVLAIVHESRKKPRELRKSSAKNSRNSTSR